MYRTVENLRDALAKQLLINEQLHSENCGLNLKLNRIALENNKLKLQLNDNECYIKTLNVKPTLPKLDDEAPMLDWYG